MVSITLNNALFSKISNVHIFRTMHRIVMIFSSKCRLQVTWQMLSTFGTVEYSTGPMRTHKETTNSTSKFGSKMAELKTPKIAHETKNWIFSKSKISIHQSNHVKRNIKPMLVRPQKRFRTTCGVFEIVAKIWLFALPRHLSVGFSTVKFWGGQKSKFLQVSQRPRKWS